MKYLTNTMRDALDYFNSHEPNLQGRFFDVTVLPIDYATVEQLVRKDFAQWADKQHTAILLLDWGKHYREIVKRDRFTYIRDNLVTLLIGFVVGVAVSFVTMKLQS